jgi:antitoxin component YwqK of YwqJK toxin-antitoxin module
MFNLKSLFTSLFIVLGVTFSIAQSQPDGPYKAYYDSGELKVEGQYKNAERYGQWKNYYKNGQVSSLYSYEDGKRNEGEVSYYESGKVSQKVEKKGDVYIRSGYYESGKLQFERQVKSGYYRSYFESGTLKVEATYEDRELVGVWKRYYENGNLEWKINYVDGYREGDYQLFYEDGSIKREGRNSKGKLNGEERRYLTGNILEWKGFYEDGILSKTWTKYDTNGKKIEKVKFKDGIASKTEYADVLHPTKLAVAVIERVPVYPGCEVYLTNTKRKACMAENVNRHIGKSFNTDLALDLNLKGRQRILVNFKVNKKGEITEIYAKAPHPGLEKEAVRVIELLPKMTPGYQREEPVTIPFSIPIVFQVAK